MPLTLGDPVQPPEALQDVAFADDQVSIVDSPALIVICKALMDAVGCGLDAEPPPQADISAMHSIGKRRFNLMTYHGDFLGS